MPSKPNTPATAAPTIDPDALAALIAAAKEAAALTPKKRTPGIRKLRTFFDTDLILSTAKKLPATADYLDLLDALEIDDDSEIGPKIRTRLSQLINNDRLAETFRPIAPGGKPLYLATKKLNAMRQTLRDSGMTDDQIDAALAATTEGSL